MAEHHPADSNGDGKVSDEEQKMYLEFKRKELEDADAMRDAVWTRQQNSSEISHQSTSSRLPLSYRHSSDFRILAARSNRTTFFKKVLDFSL
jgi:uncharacterized protein (DUF2461 family)